MLKLSKTLFTTAATVALLLSSTSTQVQAEEFCDAHSHDEGSTCGGETVEGNEFTGTIE